ncbi:unnamed protein product [Rodentolepis nana]|uniref:Uncharacterized protein n=1 Tax=Rodentolepis nana TaxID=102285 RepID=A0A0R3T516_RODNA|nr:unnamed protein product [Rodentolepis nana]
MNKCTPFAPMKLSLRSLSNPLSRKTYKTQFSFQLIKQFANSDSGIERSNSETNTKTLDIGVMHRYKLGSNTSGVRNSIHMTPQDHRKMPSPVSATPPVVSRHVGSSAATTASGSINRPVSHRRRNSQPSRSTLNARLEGGALSSTSGGGGSASFQQRNTPVFGGASGGIDNALSVTANQRVTEWLRSAGSVPEEADEEEEEPIHCTHQKVS